MKVTWSGSMFTATPDTSDEKAGIEYCNRLSSIFIQEYFSRFFSDKAKQAKANEKSDLFQAYDILSDADKIAINAILNKGK